MIHADIVRRLAIPAVLVGLLAACGKKPADVEGVWEVDIEATTTSIAKDNDDLALDPRILKIKSATRGGFTPPGDRGEIIKMREMELRAVLKETLTEVEFRPDGNVVVSSIAKGERVAKQPERWELADGKVTIGGGTNTYTFDGNHLKGRLFDGHPGAAYLKKR